MVKNAAEMAREWMPGLRNGPTKRPAWKHPEDIVVLLTELLGTPEPELVSIAWLHDVIEDGVTAGGKPVTAETLREAGVPEAVVAGVVALTHRHGETKTAYLEALRTAPAGIRLVKVADRICNLREGKDCFKAGRWARYVEETAEYIVPLVEGLGEYGYLETRLKAMLAEPVAARPV